LEKKINAGYHPIPNTNTVSFVFTAQRYIATSKDPVSTTDQRVFKQAQDEITRLTERVNNFTTKHGRSIVP